MNLQLKFNIGDTAYVVAAYKIHQVTIKRIRIDIQTGNHCLVEYEVKGGPNGFGTYKEEYLFHTKNELINSL